MSDAVVYDDEVTIPCDNCDYLMALLQGFGREGEKWLISCPACGHKHEVIGMWATAPVVADRDKN